jgi:ABC-type phosphate transport system substrate-binding protein
MTTKLGDKITSRKLQMFSFVSIILSLVLLQAACGNGSTDIRSSPPLTGKETNSMDPLMPIPNYPIIDGSSSTEIMHSAIRAYLTDIHLPVTHSQTYAALERLAPGNVNPADVVLAVKYYDETMQEMANKGANLVVTPIAKEGFVFLLHKDNPINSLTQEQLRDIFSGKVKNWKELGGLDEPIVPVHRNWDSGSQTAILDFMGDVPLTDMAEDDSIKVALSMGDMVETVWTTGTGAIGYNILSWSMGQGYVFGMAHIKFLAVDGVSPSILNLSDSSYPLMVYTYSYYDESNGKGKALTDWLLTEEGQGVITSAGYVGIFGSYSTEEMPDFYKDDMNSAVKTEHYYQESGTVDLGPFAYSHSYPHFDPELTEALSLGRGKAVTILRLVYVYNQNTEESQLRFVVLARENDGEFEIINEGDYEEALLATNAG